MSKEVTGWDMKSAESMHPGVFILDLVYYDNLCLRTVANELFDISEEGVGKDDCWQSVVDIILGRKKVDEKMAEALSSAMHNIEGKMYEISKQFWLNLQKQHDQHTGVRVNRSDQLSNSG